MDVEPPAIPESDADLDEALQSAGVEFELSADPAFKRALLMGYAAGAKRRKLAEQQQG